MHPDPAPPAGYERHRHGVHLLSRADVIADPEIYRRAVRELPPVYWDEVGKVWVCSSYAESSQVLRGHERFLSARLPDPARLAARGLTEIGRVAELMTRQMLFLDGAEHTRLRAAVRPAFAPAAIAAREHEVSSIVDSLLAPLPATGTVDIVAAVAGPLPTRLIASRLDLTERLADLLAWVEAYETVLGGLGTMPHIADRAVIPIVHDRVVTAAGRGRAAGRWPGRRPDHVAGQRDRRP